MLKAVLCCGAHPGHPSASGVTAYKSEINLHIGRERKLCGGAPKQMAEESKGGEREKKKEEKDKKPV